VRGGDDVGSDWEHAGRGRAARERGTDRDSRGSGRAAPKDAARAGKSGSPKPVPPKPVPPNSVPPKSVPPGVVPVPRRPEQVPGRRSARGRAQASGRPLATRYRRRRLAAATFGVVALLVVVVLGTRVLLYDAGFANVEDLTVTGLTTVPEQAVRDAAAVTPGGPLISVDTAGIATRVAALEGVASVEVRRAWPHTVEVDVTERVPVALWQAPQGLYEVDTTGLSYRRAPDPPPALPRLTFTGVAPQDPATIAAITVLRDLTDPLRAQVATVAVAGTQVTLGLVGDRSVRWGDPGRSADKIAVLGPLLGQPGSVYDVSSPDLPTVRP
jgi:cell division protein FtsQ